ncbi:MAG TPA: hypothetical protein VGY55_19155 [Pirellulales bacterium]|jgi:hypothetical protein|nr:hypothetical protein [Pirellulales bacterium]
MTILNPELIQALQQAGGGPVTVVNPQTGIEYVVVRADLYQRVKSLFETDDLSSEEKRLLLAESGKRAGSDSPEMDEYDDYDAHRP